jgi:hypothetical protein
MDPNQPQEPKKESLAQLGPSPYVAEGAHERAGYRLGVGTTFLLAGIGGIGAFLLIEATPQHVEGATRSMQLKWQQRQLENEKAAQDAELTDCPRE